MKDRVLIISGHGVGDCLLSLQCAKNIESIANVTIKLAVRDEVFNPLNYLFGDNFNIEQIDEKYGKNNNIIKNEDFWQLITKDYQTAYYVIPDLLFNNKYAFDFKRYGLSVQTIATTRLLLYNNSKPNIIYLGLITTTAGYDYINSVNLAIRLAKEFPLNLIYFPILEKWANKNIEKLNFPIDIPINLKIDKNPDFIESIKILECANYFIGTDNGPSHLAYHMGIPRLILDPQYGKLPWIARWRENYYESVPNNISVGDIIDIVKNNLTVPSTCLIPRIHAMGQPNWQNNLLLKTE